MGFSCQPTSTCPALCSSLSCSPNERQWRSLNLNWKSVEKALLLSLAIAVGVWNQRLTIIDINFTSKWLLSNCLYLISQKKTLPGTLVNQFPRLFIWCINSIVQISKPYDSTAQLIARNHKSPLSSCPDSFSSYSQLHILQATMQPQLKPL
jgi:hypothetical protein